MKNILLILVAVAGLNAHGATFKVFVTNPGGQEIVHRIEKRQTKITIGAGNWSCMLNVREPMNWTSHTVYSSELSCSAGKELNGVSIDAGCSSREIENGHSLKLYDSKLGKQYRVYVSCTP